MKKPTQRDKCLKALRDTRHIGGVSSLQLAEIAGLRFGARVMELRRQGYEIAVRQVKAGLFYYTLTHDPEHDTAQIGLEVD